MRPLELIVMGLISAFVFLNGCATSQTSTSKEMKSSSSVVHEYSLSNSQVKVESLSVNEGENIDDLMKKTEDYIDYINFRKNYSGQEDEIIRNIKTEKFYEAEQSVRELATKLENDPSRYAKQYLEKLKNFNYIIYEVYDVKTVTTHEYMHPGKTQQNLIGLCFFSPQAIVEVGKSAFTEERAFTQTRTSTRDAGQEVRKIKVIPYSGKREFIEKISYSQFQREAR